MATLKISLSESEDVFIERMVAEGQGSSRAEVIIRALERYAQDQAVEPIYD